MTSFSVLFNLSKNLRLSCINAVTEMSMRLCFIMPISLPCNMAKNLLMLIAILKKKKKKEILLID